MGGLFTSVKFKYIYEYWISGGLLGRCQPAWGGVDDCLHEIPSQAFFIKGSAFDLITQIRNVNMAFDR